MCYAAGDGAAEDMGNGWRVPNAGRRDATEDEDDADVGGADDMYDVTCEEKPSGGQWECTCASFLLFGRCKHVEATKVKVVPGHPDPRDRVAGPPRGIGGVASGPLRRVSAASTRQRPWRN
eukprot:TRINITY_DN1786_c0_g2_i1.p3 TRINITY_DN1786_c0_g2~~TRINITY_DN1786_c0_g2_i1.p3  ORF type:complete len:121 (+),score=20.26 TRINITY_DN1786_c0_g2_i1:369-731(+)